MPEPDTATASAVEQLDGILADLSRGIYKSSYECQIIERLREVRKTLVPPTIVRVTITFAVDEAALRDDYNHSILASPGEKTTQQMLTEILQAGYHRVIRECKHEPIIEQVS